ncbi:MULTISPECIES: CrcB family protein [unclassified Virgibacillus]|uniref:fluoride efflux transporter FluC n=1 Tax=unclassified Virgibacillus TaxID=2620237 RepID=UPI0024DE3134|nr:CrcB family protein [Virgibacillus sp. LDC-1]
MSQHIKPTLLLAVGAGGMIGAAGRYGISTIFQPIDGFPFPTLLANLVGCFLLSYLLYFPPFKRSVSSIWSTVITVGILGAFTTFSTFAVETVLLAKENMLLAVSYVFISIIGGLLLCFAGFSLAQRWGSK